MMHRSTRHLVLIALVAACAGSEPISPEIPTPTDPTDPTPRLETLHLVPEITDLPAGDTVQFEAYARTEEGDSVAAPVEEWTTTGGTISSTGEFAAGTTPGTYIIVATLDGEIADTATVTIVPVIVDVIITPTDVELAPGESQQFYAHGITSTGDTIAVDVVWSVTGGGTITQDGLFTAGPDGGTFQIIATLVTEEEDAPAALVTRLRGTIVRLD